ncbi:prephenate dehydrogenase [Thalassoglobus polymorphus]|uniref:Prephenate dehydrogenase n=2 Tax=Thalassoglobus polymorphus TaxID=2527994 RepID=A0A517QLT7_9PLAN|nr:prephenate dehydrogenase [Thalassoglobus polymorphus]
MILRTRQKPTRASLSTILRMSRPLQQFENLAIVGVGLIGGSIALAAKKHGLTRNVIGIGRNEQRLKLAKEQKLIDVALTDVTQLQNVDIAVVCTPVSRIAEDVIAVAQATPASTLITDAGSVKASLCTELDQYPEIAARFVGSHPLAGSHQSGFENANASLYENRKCVVTPSEHSPQEVVQTISSFWTQLGMDVRFMSPREHDHVLAMTSHLPHLVAAAVADQIDDHTVDFAATGFRDTTRVAAGDPGLWTAIFSENAPQLVHVTDQLIAKLTRYRNALLENDGQTVSELLKQAQEKRKLFEDRQRSSSPQGE